MRISSRHVRNRSVAVWVLVGLVFSGSLFTRGNAEEEFAPLRITEFQGELGVESEYYRDQVKHKDARLEDYWFRRVTIEEYLRLALRGSIYHPRFLKFRLAGKLRFVQQEFDASFTESRNLHDVFREYDVTVVMLEKHPYTVTGFARRHQSWATTLFSNRFYVLHEDYGGRIDLKFLPFPTQISLRKSRRVEDGAYNQRIEDRETVSLLTRHSVGEWLRSTLRYDYTTVDEEYEFYRGQYRSEQQTELSSHMVDFSNQLWFGPKRTKRLLSTIRYFTQQGSYDLRSLRASQRLVMDHSRWLQTYLRYGIQDTSTRSQDIRVYEGEAGLRHQLFDSLTTRLEAHGRREEQERFDSTTVGGSATLDYRKTTALGLLTAGFGICYDRIKQDIDEAVRSIFDEQHVLEDGRRVWLRGQDVIRLSVKVRDLRRERLYVEGLDYRLIPVGNRLMIERVVGGDIANGEVVAIDYNCRVQLTPRINSISQHFYIQHDFERWLSLYYQYARTDQDGDGDGQLRLLNDERHTVGARVRWKNLEFVEEYEDYHSGLSGYEQLRSEGSIHFRPTARTYAGLLAQHLHVEYSDDGDRTNQLQLLARFRAAIRRSTTIELEGGYRRETGRIDEALWALKSCVKWTWRKLSLEAGVNLQFRDYEDSDLDRRYVYVRMSRKL